MKPIIKIKRVYEKPSKEDGARVLVDRLWPRGLKKDTAAIDEWAKELAPTTALRQWFGHDPALWPEFQKKYTAELKKNPAVAAFKESHGHTQTITLLYGAHDEQHNQALVLQQYLDHLYHTA